MLDYVATYKLNDDKSVRFKFKAKDDHSAIIRATTSVSTICRNHMNDPYVEDIYAAYFNLHAVYYFEGAKKGDPVPDLREIYYGGYKNPK